MSLRIFSSQPARTAIVAALIALGAITVAHADDVPEQRVWLKNGGFVRGELIDLAPGDHITIKLITGEVRKISWAEVDRTSAGGSAPTSANSGSTQPTASTSSAPSVLPSVTTAPQSSAQVAPAASSGGPPEHAWVAVYGRKKPVVLQGKKLDSAGEWANLCDSPCNTKLRVAEQEFRVTGNGVTPSNSFRIEPGEGVTRLEVFPGNPTNRWWGKTLFISGLSAAFVGFATYGAIHVTRYEERDAVGYVGLGVAIAGGAALLASFPLIYSGGTRVRTPKGEPIASRTRFDWTF